MSTQTPALGLDATRPKRTERERIAGALPPLEAARWAVYYQDKALAIVDVPHRVAMQIAKQVKTAVVISMNAAARLEHQHQLGEAVCAKCAGKDNDNGKT